MDDFQTEVGNNAYEFYEKVISLHHRNSLC